MVSRTTFLTAPYSQYISASRKRKEQVQTLSYLSLGGFETPSAVELIQLELIAQY